VARDDEFAEFVGARYRALVRTGLLMTGDADHAEDLARSALIKTYLARGRLRAPANAEAYTRRTLVRLALCAKQRRWTAEFAARGNPGDGTGAAAAPLWLGPDDVAVDVRRALAALPSGQRAVIVLRYLDDQSEEDTARLLNIPLGTVQSRAARGLVSLRQAGLLDLEGGRHADDRQVRALLSRAAQLPYDIPPPVAPLVQVARRTRRLHIAGSVLAIVVIVAAALVLPPSLSALVPASVGGSPTHPHVPDRPSAWMLSQYSWSALARSPLGARSDPLLAWTGSKLLELGGTKNGVTQNDGAAFDPRTERWALIAPVKGDVSFSDAVGVWTGRELFVTNGQTASCPGVGPVSGCLPRAGLYNPTTNRWTTTLLPRQLEGLDLAGAAWTGRNVVVAGINAAHNKLGVAAYAPRTGRWRMITPRLPRRHPAQSAAFVASRNRVILWSLWSRDITLKKGSGTTRFGVDVLSFGPTGQWSNVTGSWPQNRDVDGPIYANGQILIRPAGFWCSCPSPFGDVPAKLANATTLDLTTLPTGPLVTKPMFEPSIWLWTGRAVIAAKTYGASKSAPGGHISNMAAYDPLTGRWYVLSHPAGKPALGAYPIFAAGQVFALSSSGVLLILHPMFM